ncbi:MAG: helix-turn-helix domain-containing protein [Lysobacter sp.]
MRKSIHKPEYLALLAMVRKQRTACGMTQTALSEALARPQPYISTIETGVRRLDVVELREICQVLGVSIVDLIGDWDAEIRSRARRPQRKS